MPMYNLSTFMTLLKQDIGIKDIVLPVSDQELTDRFINSALMEFSQRSPRIETCMIDDSNLVEKENINRGEFRTLYRIPPWVYDKSTILGVPKFDVARPSGYMDFYVPQGMWASPDSVLEAIADIKMAAGVASAMGRAPTHMFRPPDIIVAFNVWSAGKYNVEVAMTHDPSLSTVSPTAFTHLRQLAVLDLEEFLYSKMKRLDNLDVGIGNIQLKIDNWEQAKSQKDDLLKMWDDEGANLDIDNMQYF